MSNETKILWKVRNAVFKLLTRRGYKIPEENYLDLEEFQDWAGDSDVSELRDSLGMEVSSKKGDIAVRWVYQINVNLGGIVADIESKNCKKVLIVTETGITSPQINNVEKFRTQGIVIDYFKTQELLFDPLSHEFVPEHEICTVEEKKAVLKSYAVTTKKLPQILKSDIIIRYIGAKKGQLIRITRNSETQLGHKAISYRIVI